MSDSVIRDLVEASDYRELRAEVERLRGETAQHCADYQSIVAALGILEELPEPAQTGEHIGALRTRLVEIEQKFNELQNRFPGLTAELDELRGLVQRGRWLEDLDFPNEYCFALDWQLVGRTKALPLEGVVGEVFNQAGSGAWQTFPDEAAARGWVEQQVGYEPEVRR